MMMGHQMRKSIPAVAVLAAVALGGCGSSGTNSSTPPVTEPVVVALRSSAIHGRTLPALYTCDGRNVSPPLSWGALPSGVEELALFAVGTRRGRGGRALSSVEWAMAGLKPKVHGVSTGEIPRGAYLLAGSAGKRGYSVCPPRGETERYSFALYALPRGARASTAMSGPLLIDNLTQAGPKYQAPVSGTFSVVYKRR
jgi:phosphatidylethanolamine-binding protein (PEBP) family uncharacterized protein